MLGATGSIGRQALEVADRLGLPVAGLAAGHVGADFLALAAAHPAAALAVASIDPIDAPADITGRLERGPDAVETLAATPGTIVINGIVGAAGLAPSLAALSVGNRLALANKETLIAGGALVAAAAAAGGGEVVPVDSEHSALWQCLVGEDAATVARLVLTASGGPFRGWGRKDLAAVTPEQALAHPTWDMGRRISIDSATMMNKTLEVIEAHLLFGVGYDRIEVLVHPQSIVHSLVEFVDGSLKAQLGDPDMRVPIQYAITEPGRAQGATARTDLAGRSLTFEAADLDAFPCLELGFVAGRRGGVVPAALNAADEVAVQAFLEGELGFLGIHDVVAEVVAATPDVALRGLEDVLEADADARRRAVAEIRRRASSAG